MARKVLEVQVFSAAPVYLSNMKNICTASTVERAKKDFSLGLPVLVECKKKCKMLIASVEVLNKETFEIYKEIGYKVLIPSIRAELFYGIGNNYPVWLNPKGFFCDFGKTIDVLINNIELPLYYEAEKGEENDQELIDFAKSAEMFPCVIVARVDDNVKVMDWCKHNNIMFFSISDIQSISGDVDEVCRSPLVLHENVDVEIIVYRYFSKIHCAIIIGNPFSHVKTPLVRIHSSCYTGDVLGSLTCDCGKQLESAINFMSENEGGVILYLSQEGRGIGLANKIRAYSEQFFNCSDTVAANNSLGFNADERDFKVAALILKKLDLRKIKIITNNKKKIAQLQKNGVQVESYIVSRVKYNRYNMHYLHTKFSKLGHMLNY